MPEIIPRTALMLDLARQVETPATLRKIVRWAAGFGYDELFLYGEGGFQFPSHPDISYPWALAPDDYRQLDQYAAGHGLRMIPIVPLLGHAAYILGSPALRGLNELQADTEPAIRCGEHTLCPSHPGTLQLAEDMIRDICLVSSSPYIHVGGDEAWNFAVCPRCRVQADKVGRGPMLAEYFNKLNAIVKQQRRRMMIWHDMLYYYDQALARLDRDIVICFWHYKPVDPHPRIALYNHRAVPFLDTIREYGFDFYFCSKSKYDYEYESRNICSLQQYYSARPALGYMNTVWCMKSLPFSVCLPSLAYGAARTARPDLEPAAFLEEFARAHFAGSPYLTALLPAVKQAAEYPAAAALEQVVDYRLPEQHALLAASMRAACALAEQLPPATEPAEAYREALLLLFRRCELFAAFKNAANRFARGGPAEFEQIGQMVPPVLAMEQTLWNKYRPAADRNPVFETVAAIPRMIQRLLSEGRGCLPHLLEVSLVNNDCAYQDLGVRAFAGDTWADCGQAAQCGPFGQYEVYFPVPAGVTRTAVTLAGVGELLLRHVRLLGPGICRAPAAIGTVRGNVRDARNLLRDDYTFLTMGRADNQTWLAAGRRQPPAEFEVLFEFSSIP